MSNPTDATYADWVGNTEISEDIASQTAALRLGSITGQFPIPNENGIPLLPTLGHWAQFTTTTKTEDLGPDGHLRLGSFLPPLELPRRMWAGSSIAFHAPIQIGSPITRETTIQSITPKIGASGPLCFIRLRHDIQSDGTLALTEHQTVVYREAVPRGAAQLAHIHEPRVSAGEPEGWDWVRTTSANEVMLFRYSALTFNAHRIHYDLAYANQVEGYPGIVVHAPLCMSLLVTQFEHELPGARLSKLEFSAHAPIFANEEFHLVGRSISINALELAVIGPDGEIAISAKAEYAS